MGKRVRNVVVMLLVAGFCLAAACSVARDNAEAQGLVLNGGCLSGTDSTTAAVSTGFRTWYTAVGAGVYGLTRPDGLFRYVSVVAFSDNTGNVYVTRYAIGEVVAVDIFGPGGGFADYVVCDSMDIAKTAADVVSYKMCK